MFHNANTCAGSRSRRVPTQLHGVITSLHALVIEYKISQYWGGSSFHVWHSERKVQHDTPYDHNLCLH
jgi:hypothetical protein